MSLHHQIHSSKHPALAFAHLQLFVLYRYYLYIAISKYCSLA